MLHKYRTLSAEKTHMREKTHKIEYRYLDRKILENDKLGVYLQLYVGKK